MSRENQPHYVVNGEIVLTRLPNAGILQAAGNTVPADASAGYLPGCLFHHIDGLTGVTVLYVNIGTATSCDFNALNGAAPATAPTAALTTITPASAPGTPDYAIADPINTNAYGFTSADEFKTVMSVIVNNQARLAEVIAALQARGLMAS